MTGQTMTREQQTEATGERQRLGERFLAALDTRDFAAVEKCFHPEAHWRALLGSGLREGTGAAEAAAAFRAVYGDSDHHELLHGDAEPIADRLHLMWRFRVHDEDGWQVNEQHAFCDVRNGRIERLDLLCSGFLPQSA